MALGGPFPFISKPFRLFFPGTCLPFAIVRGVRGADSESGRWMVSSAIGRLGEDCGRVLGGSRDLGVEKVLADWVRLCSFTLTFVARTVGNLKLLLVLAVEFTAGSLLSWPCIASGDTSEALYVGRRDAVSSLRASGGSSIFHEGPLTIPEKGNSPTGGSGGFSGF